MTEKEKLDTAISFIRKIKDGCLPRDVNSYDNCSIDEDMLKDMAWHILADIDGL